ncbi:MAG: DUF4160 domain-containing protein [Solirubrobacteraceae bacterium]
MPAGGRRGDRPRRPVRRRRGLSLRRARARRQLRLVQAWVELHRDELRTDWELAVKTMPLIPIDPRAAASACGAENRESHPRRCVGFRGMSKTPRTAGARLGAGARRE